MSNRYEHEFDITSTATGRELCVSTQITYRVEPYVEATRLDPAEGGYCEVLAVVVTKVFDYDLDRDVAVETLSEADQKNITKEATEYIESDDFAQELDYYDSGAYDAHVELLIEEMRGR